MALQSAHVGPIVGVSETAAAQSFYERTLGLRGEDTPGGRVVHAGDGSLIYLLEVGEQAGSAPWPVASFRVDDLETTVATLRERGVDFLGDDDLPFDLDASGIADQGGMAVAWMRDPDGNVLTVFELR